MDKNGLSIGILFRGKDENFEATLKKVIGGATQAGDALQKAGVQASGKGGKGGFFGKISEGMKMLSIAKIGGMMQDIRDSLTGKGMGVDDLFKSLDTLEAKIAQALDPKLAAKFKDQLVAVKTETGMTAQETDDLAMGLMQYGRNLNEMTKSLPMAGKLIGIMGMNAEHVARMFGEGLANLNATPAQMESLIKQTAKMQKAYKLTGMMEMLPDIFDSVSKNALVYGKVQTDTAMKASLSVLKLAGAFQKVGKSQSAALGAAKGMQSQFAEMNKSILGMQLGMGPLSDKTLKTMQYFTEAGFSDVEALDLIKQGQTDVAGVIEKVQNQLKGKDITVKQRVSMGLSEAFGSDDIGEAIFGFQEGMQDAVAAADKEAQKLGSPTAAFDSMTTSMKNTVSVQEKLRDSMKDSVDLAAAFANKKDYIKALEAQRDGWAQAARAVEDADSWLGKVWKKFKLFEQAGLSGLFAPLGEFVPLFDMLNQLIFPLTALMGVFHIFGSTLTTVGSVIWGVLVGGMQAFTAVLAATPVGWIIAAIVAIGAAVYLLVKYWDEVSTAVGVVWDGIVEGAKWAWGFLSKIAQTWWAVTSTVVGSVFKLYKAVFGKIWDAAKWAWGKISSVGGDVWDGIKGAFMTFWDWAKGAFNDFGTLLQPVFAFLADAGKALISPFASMGDGIKAMFDQVVGWFKSAMDAIWNIMPDWMKSFLKMTSTSIGSVASGLMGDVKKIWSGSDAVEKATAPATPMEVAKQAAPGQAPVALKNQQGAPEKAALGADFMPTVKPTLKDQNFQAVVNSILDMKDTLAKLLGELADRPVSVELKGDARKFFNAANKESANKAGQLGLAGAVTQ